MIGQINKEYIKTRTWKLYSRMLSYFLFEGRPLTTRGQWINPLVFIVYKIASFLPKLKIIKEPIFIIGTGRSGTTILGIIMSMHKQVGFLNEPKALWHEAYPFEDLIGSYTIEEANYRLTDKDANASILSKIHKIFGFYLTITFSSRVVDKYPELIFRISFVKALFPDAKFIFLVRNGWDTCHSINAWSSRLGKNSEEEVHDWWGRDNRKWILLRDQILKTDDYYADVLPVLDQIKSHTDMAALEWIATMREGIRMVTEYPNEILTVKYEELVAHPSSMLNNIESYCNLSHDEVFIQYGKTILQSTPEKKAFFLHESIKPLFHETMEQLGYNVLQKKIV